MREDRAQLATPMVEVTVGALLVLAVAAGFAVVDGGTDGAASLDRTAADALAVLLAEPPEGSGVNRLSAACRSEAAFEVERDALGARLDAILPAPLSYRLTLPHGRVGPAPPSGVPSGEASATTDGCTATLRVWYV